MTEQQLPTDLEQKPHEELVEKSVGIRVKILTGHATGESYELRTSGTKSSFIGGRSPKSDLHLPDPKVSNRHFEIALSGKQARLRDIGSTNGIRIAGASVEEAWLAPGCEFEAGETRLRVDYIETTRVPASTHIKCGTMAGASEAIRALFSTLERYGPSPFSALITGETGTGKGEVARTLHELSGRTGPFVLLDCATVPRELASSVVLGHAKGVFTGATTDRKSPFEQAEGGTLFLDEVGELPLDLQQVLLTVLGSGAVQRVGDSTLRKVDVRIVAATNRDLQEEVYQRRFREDLYFRLAEFPISVPALRERPEDILHLAAVFLEEFAAELQLPLAYIGEDAKEELLRQSWRGNVRELRNVIRRAAFGCSGGRITRKDLRRPAASSPEQQVKKVLKLGLEGAVDEVTRDLCRELIDLADGSKTEAARLAGYSKRGFFKLLARLGVD